MISFKDYEKPIIFIERKITKLRNQLIYSQLDEIFKDEIDLSLIKENAENLENEIRALGKKLDLQTQNLSIEEYEEIESEHLKADEYILKVQYKVWAVQTLISLIEELKEKWSGEDKFEGEERIDLSEKLTIRRLLF
jgi:hypothetical protein